MNLYDLDDDGYYSSSSSKYITLEMDLESDFVNNLNRFLCIANKTNRIAILPKIKSKDKNPQYRSYVNLINIAAFEKRFGKKYRVSSFLDNINIPLSLKKGKIIILDRNITVDSLLLRNEQLISISKLTFADIICNEGEYIILDSQWQTNGVD